MTQEFEDIDITEWYAQHQKDMREQGKYRDPCENCGGEDCACCSYGCGY